MAPHSSNPQKLTFKEKFRKRWYLHLINFVVGTIVISMLLNYVALPRIAQHDLNNAVLRLDSQIVSNPTPNSVDLQVVNTVYSPSWFTPQIDGFDAKLFLENTEPDIKPFGVLKIPGQHALHNYGVHIDQHLDIIDMDQFIAYNKIVTQSEKFRFAMRGRTKLHLGALPVATVDFNKVIETPGLNSFKGITITNVNISLTNFEDGSNMHGLINIPNPSVMTLTIGDMLQDIFVDGTNIGETTINNVVLRPGDNLFPMSSKTNQALILPLLSTKYKNGVLPIEARTRTIKYNNQSLPYFEEAMKATPVHLNLDISVAMKNLGLDMSALSGGSSSSGSSSSGSS